MEIKVINIGQGEVPPEVLEMVKAIAESIQQNQPKVTGASASPEQHGATADPDEATTPGSNEFDDDLFEGLALKYQKQIHHFVRGLLGEESAEEEMRAMCAALAFSFGAVSGFFGVSEGLRVVESLNKAVIIPTVSDVGVKMDAARTTGVCQCPKCRTERGESV